MGIVVELDELIQTVQASDLTAIKCKRLDLQIAQKRDELDGYKEFKDQLLEALRGDLIDNDEYVHMRDKYRRLQQDAQLAINDLLNKKADIQNNRDDNISWVGQYMKYKSLKQLSREASVTLIDKIIIHEDKSIEIVFNYKDEIAYYSSLMSAALQEVG